MNTAMQTAESLLARMTLPEKIGQMTQVEKNSITPAEVAEFGVGSVISGGGGNPAPNTPHAWAAMVRGYQAGALETRLRIPLLYGVDAVHGHNNLRGATIFPHNIGLGAVGDAELVGRIAQVTARELLATNVHWNFAPAVSVPQDIRWGRTYEGYSDDTELVSRLAVAYLRGLQGDGAHSGQRPVLGCPKHFVGDGGTSWGSTARYAWVHDLWQAADPQRWRIDQGDTLVDEATLRQVHLAPYAAAIAAGARSIMVSYSSWHGAKLHAHRYLLTDVLKCELGFAGFLVSDWLALLQLNPDPDLAVAAAINAGLDMVMVPFDYRTFIAAVTRGVARGVIPLARIDDAVLRILRTKVALGLFAQPFGEEAWLPEVGAVAHREVARAAVRKSLVLLKNDDHALPLAKNLDRVLVAGPAANDLGRQCGGWTIEWQGTHGPSTLGVTLLAAVARAVSPHTVVEYEAHAAFGDATHAAAGIVVVGESPYSEGEGDRSDLALTSEDLALIARMRRHCEVLVVVVYSGRPLWIAEALAQSDACVAAWLPGTEGDGMADVLFGAAAFTGKLPCAWPLTGAAGGGALPRGYGLTAN